jgi:hypothetical protein
VAVRTAAVDRPPPVGAAESVGSMIVALPMSAVAASLTALAWVGWPVVEVLSRRRGVVQVRRWRDRLRWPAGASIGVALLVAAVLVVAPLAPDAAPPLDRSRDETPKVPAGSVLTMPSLLEDGTSYAMRYIVDANRTIGVAAAADGSEFAVVVVDGDRIVARLRDLPSEDAPFFDAFVLSEGSIYWTETTIGPDGTDVTQLWAAAVAAEGVGEARLVVPDMGFAVLSGSAYDVIVADGMITWAAVAGANQPETLVRSVPMAGGDITENAWPGAWRQIARPWLASNTSGGTILLNQSTGEQVTVPGSDVAATRCAPDRCRVTVTSAGDNVRLELVAPDGAERIRVAGPRTKFAGVDPLALGRCELLDEIGGALAPGDMRLMVYDSTSGTTAEVETGPESFVNVRDGWAWWLAGDVSAPIWHVLNLASLAP